MSAQQSTGGFLEGLFDLSFEKTVTRSVLKVVYVLVIIGLTLAYLAYSIAAFAASTALGIAVLVIIGPLVWLLELLLWRILFEIVITIFKIADNTRMMATGGALEPASPTGTAPTVGASQPPPSVPPPAGPPPGTQ